MWEGGTLTLIVVLTMSIRQRLDIRSAILRLQYVSLLLQYLKETPANGYITMFQVSIWSLRNLVAAFSDRLSRAHLPTVTTSHEAIDAWKLRILYD